MTFSDRHCPTPPHGSWAGKLGHLRHGEPPCPECAAASPAYVGPHATCHATSETKAAEFHGALWKARADELRDAIDLADRAEP